MHSIIWAAVGDLLTWEPREDTAQPVQSDLSWRCLPEESLDLWICKVPSEDFDHPVWFRRLIGVFAGCIMLNIHLYSYRHILHLFHIGTYYIYFIPGHFIYLKVWKVAFDNVLIIPIQTKTIHQYIIITYQNALFMQYLYIYILVCLLC